MMYAGHCRQFDADVQYDVQLQTHRRSDAFNSTEKPRLLHAVSNVQPSGIIVVAGIGVGADVVGCCIVVAGGDAVKVGVTGVPGAGVTGVTGAGVKTDVGRDVGRDVGFMLAGVIVSGAMVSGFIVAGFMLDGDGDGDPESETDVVSDADTSSEADDETEAVNVCVAVAVSVPGVALIESEIVPLVAVAVSVPGMPLVKWEIVPLPVPEAVRGTACVSDAASLAVRDSVVVNVAVAVAVSVPVPDVALLVEWESVPLLVRVRRTHVAFALLYDVPAAHSMHMGLGNDSSGQRRKATAMAEGPVLVPKMMCWPMATAV